MTEASPQLGLEQELPQLRFAVSRTYAKGSFVDGVGPPGPGQPQAKPQNLASRDPGSEQPTIRLAASELDSSMGFTRTLSPVFPLLPGMVTFINTTSVAV